MRGDETTGELSRPWVPLTAGELTRRRAAQRRRRRQRRIATVAGLIALAVAAIAVARSHVGGSGSRAAQARSAGASRHHRHSGQAYGEKRHAASPTVRAQGHADQVDVNRVLAYTSYVRLLPHRRRDV